MKLSSSKVIKTAAWLLGRFLPVKKNKIVASSYYGRGYSDSPKAIVQNLIDRNTDADIVWLLKNGEDKSELPDKVRACDDNSIKKILELSTAAVWIDNCRKGAWFKKKNQLYIQTWHGFALKRIERDVADKLGEHYDEYAMRDSRQCDVIISNSSHMTDIYKKSFWYDGEILQVGSPRNDVLFENHPEITKKVRTFFGVPEDKKILLYAPTFRADKGLSVYNMDYMSVLGAMGERFSGDWVLLLRLHPNIMSQADKIETDGKTIINATAYSDMQELLYTADAVITDYSSLMFDFCLSKKPCFMYAPDIEDYKSDRNFYISFDELPFPVAVDNAEMQTAVKNFDAEKYASDLQNFFVKFGFTEDGSASEKTADIIIKHIS